MKNKSHKWRLRTIHVVISIFLMIGIYLGYLQLSGNFHEVIAGELYRSAQPNAHMIASAESNYGIKSILNLRGENSKNEWYQEEMKVSDDLNIKHIDFRMSAGRQLSLEDTKNLIQIMKDAPKPMLIHCAGGADRTGLAVSLYLAIIKGVPAKIAGSQLSLRYGHIGIPYLSHAYPMDENWEKIKLIFRLDEQANQTSSQALPLTH